MKKLLVIESFDYGYQGFKTFTKGETYYGIFDYYIGYDKIKENNLSNLLAVSIDNCSNMILVPKDKFKIV